MYVGYKVVNKKLSEEEIFSAAFQMEADVTTSLHQLYAISERDSALLIYAGI